MGSKLFLSFVLLLALNVSSVANAQSVQQTNRLPAPDTGNSE